VYDVLDQQLLLAARPPSRLQRRLAYCVMACLLAVFCITVPYARVQLQSVTAFIPVYGTAMVIINLIIAALIVSQFWVVRWTWLLVLASGFFYRADYRSLCADISGSVCAVWLVGRWAADRPMARHVLEIGLASFPDHSHACQNFARDSQRIPTRTGHGHRFEPCSGHRNRVWLELGHCRE
jgi:hypothetical protein